MASSTVAAPLITATLCTWLLASYSTTRPSGVRITVTITQRRYHNSASIMDLLAELYQRSSAIVHA